MGCGDSTKPWWYDRAKTIREQWDTKQNDNLVVFAGDSIIECTEIYYPEFYQDARFLNAGIGGIQTRELDAALKMIGAYKRKSKAFYILTGHHDLDGCSGQSGTSIAWRTARSLTFFTSIIAKLRESNPDILIHIMNLPPLRAPLDQSEVIYFNQALHEYAVSWGAGVYYEDRWAEFIGADGYVRPELTFDEHHPNRAGSILYMDKYKTIY